MAISYNDIPNANRVPLAYIEFDNSKATSGTPAQLHKVLIVGTKLTLRHCGGWSSFARP